MKVFREGIEGVVQKVNDNSVIIKITKNETDLHFNGDVTVINY
ncbi:DUF2187 family protein [Peribacillus glennii]|uniref:DUF2187 domain-containing protein n=1 Tax=Peribacillus glennii TaxID=2303991 RepID=A0A372L6X2_9BACI|nr:DUF2187 family protein [Peribacillus glennii]RFU60870.1 DUF2187 domain-containing protein [Peribacillus glennii]